MWEPFTEEARKTIVRAQEEGQRLGHTAIGTEHLLLGIIGGEDAAAEVLANLGVSLQRAREAVVALHAPTEAQTTEFTPLAKRTIELAFEEAMATKHNFIDSQHLLLAITRLHTSVAFQALEKLGVEISQIRPSLRPVPPKPMAPEGPPKTQDSQSATPLSPFSEAARQCIVLANQEAQRLEHAAIGTEHLLLGIIAQGQSLAAKTLAGFGLDLEKARQEVVAIYDGNPQQETAGEFTPMAKRAIELALGETKVTGHSQLECEELLLGLTQLDGGVAIRIFQNLGIELSQLRSLLGQKGKAAAPKPAKQNAVWEPLTEQAKQSISLAEQEAIKLGNDYMGTEHLLLGLIPEGSCLAAAILKNLGIDLSLVREEVESMVGTGHKISSDKIYFTERTQRSVTLAFEEARGLNCNYIGTEHLLLGLLREPHGVAGKVLFNHGAEAEKIRQEAIRLSGLDQLNQPAGIGVISGEKATPKILVYHTPPSETEPVARTGGRPLAPAGTDWPMCTLCEEAMQFIAQLPLADLQDSSLPQGLLLIFMCQNDPGNCDEWDADGAGNQAMVVPMDSLQLMLVPGTGVTSLGEISGAALHPMDGTYDEARKNWPGSPKEVLGKIGGQPIWIQSDETPRCDRCYEKMRFVAMLEEGHNPRTAASFGGGAAYAFVCLTCPGQAKFLWQC